MSQFSIVIPVYNTEKYLDCCLESVLTQSFQDFEIILVDDGSPDRAPALCDAWAEKDCRIRVVHQENGGLSSARNTGIHHASGEYLLFLDSDDFFEPDLLDDACIQQMAAVKELCPQFHLSLQSGCTPTLRRMRRVYTADEYRTVVRKLRASFPSATFTTDIIVGFPGETEEEFAETVSFVREIGFLKVHVFSYSRRAGTPAYDMPDQVDESVKAQRNHLLQKEADAVRSEIIRAREGQTVEVLLEKPVAKDRYTGYTKEYIPVLIHTPGHVQGEIVPARLGSFDGERCTADPLM